MVVFGRTINTLSIRNTQQDGVTKHYVAYIVGMYHSFKFL
jgi:hypothetical protein